MAAFTASAASLASAAPVREFHGLKASTSFAKVQRVAMLPKSSGNGRGALGARCGYIGSPTNLIMVGTTALFFFAGRFGLAPSSSRKSSPGLKLVDRDSGLQTGDPANFTASDTLAFGALGHIVAVGIVLGLKATGGI